MNKKYQKGKDREEQSLYPQETVEDRDSLNESSSSDINMNLIPADVQVTKKSEESSSDNEEKELIENYSEEEQEN